MTSCCCGNVSTTKR